MKRAQLAVETLLIYGVAILIVMIAIGALFALGVVDPASWFPDECKMEGLRCENFLVTQNGVQLELRNNMNKNIRAINVTIEGKDSYEGLWQCGWSGSDDLIMQGDITPTPITIPCNIEVPVGKKIHGVISANVTFIQLQIPQRVTGNIRATVS